MPVTIHVINTHYIRRMQRLSRRELRSSPFPALPHYISVNNAGVHLSEAACDLRLAELPACLGRSGFSYLSTTAQGLPAWFPPADMRKVLSGAAPMVSVSACRQHLQCMLTGFSHKL